MGDRLGLEGGSCPWGLGRGGTSFILKLKLCLSSPSHKAWSTGDANKQWGQQMGENRVSGPPPGARLCGAVSCVEGGNVTVTNAVLATQTELRGPSSLPSSSALRWFAHAPGTVRGV